MTLLCKSREAFVDGRRYMQYSITNDFMSEGGKELLYVGKEVIYPSPSSWPVPHDAPYVTQFNHIIRSVAEASMNNYT